MEMVKESSTNKGHYSIQLASKISGVGVHTIRAWEKRYQAVVPERNASGRREYNDKDVERLSLLSELCTLGHSIGKIAHLSTGDLKVQLQKLGKKTDGHQKASSLRSPSLTVVNVEESLKILFDALEEYKIDTISEEFNRLKLVLNPRELVLKVISPLLKELEKGVETEKFNISQEHALSALIKFHTGHILFRGNHSKSVRPLKVLLCAPEGSFNEFGLLQAALLCSFYNLQFYYLGPNLPADSLLDSYRSLEGGLVILETKDDTGHLSEGFIRSYAEKVAGGIGEGRLIMDDSRVKESSQWSHLNQYSNISIMKDIEELDQLLKSL
ncbi:MAG: hypothetical protein CME60_01435 [Halobacteriovoraceae bacterium]|nr:hypothetical protein [Halobacteriovoraceae bacterium]|tara:strand:- start:1471 stop:2451 length:981 start_codon:yes stop_codon:yes gene_type:complete